MAICDAQVSFERPQVVAIDIVFPSEISQESMAVKQFLQKVIDSFQAVEKEEIGLEALESYIAFEKLQDIIRVMTGRTNFACEILKITNDLVKAIDDDKFSLDQIAIYQQIVSVLNL